MSYLVFEKQMLTEYYGDNKEDIISILSDYLLSQPQTLDAFAAAFTSGIDEVRRCVHFHSSAFAYVGFPQLYLDCAAFEKQCKEINTIEELKPSFNILVSRIKQSGDMVQEEINRLQKSKAA